jgi:carbamate kinase
VVPSPLPIAIPDTKLIKALLDQGTVVVCGGGGGIPVIQVPDGALHGIEAVVDKDCVSALLARQISADALLLLTDVKAIYRDSGRAQASAIDRISATEASRLTLPDGSMRPKVEAAIDFVRAGGGLAAIGRLEDALGVLQGQTGTRIVADDAPDP